MKQKSLIHRIKSLLLFPIKNAFYKVVSIGEQFRLERLYRHYNIDSSVRLGDVELVGHNITIGMHSYLNKGSVISSGEHSSVLIGKYCSIGRYVHISSKSHSFEVPTADEENQVNAHDEADTVIGDYVWIGDMVYVRPGVRIGNCAIIGTHSVVLRDVEDFEIVAGVPAIHIRFNQSHYKFTQNPFQ